MRLGIIVTVLLNIVACEFLYLNGVAVPAARTRVWRVSVSTQRSLAPPAVALYRLSAFGDRAILVDNNTYLDHYYRLASAPTNGFSNLQYFTNYSTFPAKGSSGVPSSGDLSYVTFNGSYSNLTTLDDIDLIIQYYCKLIASTMPIAYLTNVDDKNEILESGPPLDFVAFDPKFLTSKTLFEKAINCGIINGRLFTVTSRTQVHLEQSTIHDVVRDIEYSIECDDPAFRDFAFYRSSMSTYVDFDVDDSCALDGQNPPSDPSVSPPCVSDIDIKFSTMLVTSQTSRYSKSRTEMFTDEGGIIGAITFFTWFMGILKE